MQLYQGEKKNTNENINLQHLLKEFETKLQSKYEAMWEWNTCMIQQIRDEENILLLLLEFTPLLPEQP